MVLHVRWLSSRLPYQCKSKFGKGFRGTCIFQRLERRCQKNDGMELNLDRIIRFFSRHVSTVIKIISLLYMYFVWLINRSIMNVQKIFFGSNLTLSWWRRDLKAFQTDDFLVDSVPHGMEEPVHFGGPSSFVRIVEDVLEVFQCFLIVFLNGQSLSQITDIIYAL